MSNDEFETWLSLVGRLLGLSERQRSQIGAELRDHLESRVADLLESGMDKNSAVMQAVEEFGDAAILAKNLQSVSLRNRKRWMMRFMTLATAGLFLVALLTMAMWPEDARFGSPSHSVAQEDGAVDPSSASSVPAPSARTLINNEIRKKMDGVVNLVHDAEPFGEVRKSLASELKINIVIDSNLEGVLDDDTEVSVKLEGVRLSSALRTMLRDVDATYAIKDGVLLIISIDDETEPDYLSQHMIDVRQILALIRVSETDRIGKPVLEDVSARRAPRGGGVFAIPSQADDDAAVEQTADAPIVYPMLTAEKLLVNTVTEIVASDSWECTGGGNGMITCIGGVLVVVNCESVADQLKDFLQDLTYQMKKK